jgi:hypothetical protein
VGSLTRCLGADPQQREEGKTRTCARICLLRQVSVPLTRPRQPSHGTLR